MIKSLLKVGLILLVGIIGYNYFLGDEEEKEKARDIVGKTVDIGKAGVGLIKEEYQKFKDGKYDKALDKIGNLLKDAKQKGGEMVDEIKDWEERKQGWKEKKDNFLEGLDGSLEDMSDKEKSILKDLEKEGKALEKAGNDLKEKVDSQ